MSDNLSPPEATYSRLLGEAKDQRRIRSLEALNTVCKLLFERGNNEYSYKMIINLGRDRGLPIPGEKSIVNSTGAHYRELIQAWKLAAITDRPAKNSAIPTDWINSISDPVLRMSVTLLAKELRSLKNKISRQDKFGCAPIYLNGASEQIYASHSGSHLNEVELNALKAAIDPNTLSQFGLALGPRGEVIDNKGRTLYKPGFRDAIEKVLSVHES